MERIFLNKNVVVYEGGNDLSNVVNVDNRVDLRAVCDRILQALVVGGELE